MMADIWGDDMQSARAAAEIVMEAAPTFSNVETATVVLTAATLIVTAVALAVAVAAGLGFFVIRRAAVNAATSAAEKVIVKDLSAYLDGPEFNTKLRTLVESATIDHIRNRIGENAPVAAKDAAPQPMKDDP